MKLPFLFAWLLTALPTAVVQAAPMETCSAQAECMEFTIAKVDENACEDDENECYYEICQVFQLGGTCVKDAQDTVSHVCAKDNSTCPLEVGFAEDDGSLEVVGVATGQVFCQEVPAGGVAEFLVKDGNAKDGCGSDSIFLLGGTEAQCETYGQESCTGNGNIGKECVWRVPAPLTCDMSLGGVGGDPHMKLWNGTRYSFHGECDLVMLHADDFADGTGLDLHIRTTIIDFYSYIESAALRIGNHILQVTSGQFSIDGKQGSDDELPLALLEGYTLQAPVQIGTAKVYRVDLHQDDFVLFRTYKHFISVDVNGNPHDFGKSTGLLGNYYNGDMLGRKGQVIAHPNDFGLEWQVTPTDASLFAESRTPQLPHAQCVMPAATSRHLVQEEADPKLLRKAQQACSKKSKHDFDFCVLDVLATGDVGLAGAW